VTGGSDGVRAVIASDTLTGTEGRDASGGTLARAGGRDSVGFGGGLDAEARGGDDGRHLGGFDGVGAGGFDGVLAASFDGVFAGAEERAGFGGALARAEGRSGCGGTVANPEGVHRAGFAGTTDNGAADFGAFDKAAGDEGDVLESSGERDRAGLGTTLSVGGVTAGMSPLVATFTGTLWDSGTSSHPLSISSSAGFARFSVSLELGSAPFAISLKVPEPLAAWQARTAQFYVVTPANISEPRCVFLGT
jgi:hypothetical protein